MAKVFECSAPSNIALIKYWGKADASLQIPANDSLSMTLRNCLSKTEIRFANSDRHEIILDNETLAQDHPGYVRISKHLQRLSDVCGSTAPLHIRSSNTFPAGTGIASSASGFAALSIAGVAAFLDCHSLKELKERGFDAQVLADLARLGSGSAGRSLMGGFVSWVSGKRQTFAQDFTEAHWPLLDIIAVVDAKHKTVPSSTGHLSAPTSPLFALRQSGVHERMRFLRRAIKEKDFTIFAQLVEADALEMHAVMMTSTPRLEYLQPATISIIERIRLLRQKQGLRVCFTLDAGPNVHILCEPDAKASVMRTLQESKSCAHILCDEIGSGPELTMREETIV